MASCMRDAARHPVDDQAKVNAASALRANHAHHKPCRHRANLIQGLRLAQIKAIKPPPDTPATHADTPASGNAPAPVCQNTPNNQAPAQTSHTPIARHPHFCVAICINGCGIVLIALNGGKHPDR